MTTAILFELHHLGDAVLSVPFLRAMQSGKHQLHVVCRSSSVPIFHKFLPLCQIHTWEPWWELSGIAKIASLQKLGPLLKTLRKLKATQSYCVWADSRVHWLMRQTGAAEIIGFPVNKQNFYAHERPWRRRRMKLGQIIGLLAPLDKPLQRQNYQQSHLADWQQLTESFGLVWSTHTPWFDIFPNPLANACRQPGTKLWLMHPGGRLPTKRWPLERFQALLETTLRDVPTLLIAPPDSPALTPVTSHHQVVAAGNFDELLSLVQSVDAVLCNDSLVSHLAAALGKPVWTIFGSGNPNWFAPFENVKRVIASDICQFRPCIDRCVYASPICLEAVSLETVAARISEII